MNGFANITEEYLQEMTESVGKSVNYIFFSHEFFLAKLLQVQKITKKIFIISDNKIATARGYSKSKRLNPGLNMDQKKKPI